jgi:hypothetical protein
MEFPGGTSGESPIRQSLFSPRDESRVHYLACARQLCEKAESLFDGFEEMSSKPDRRENIVGELHLNHDAHFAPILREQADVAF